MKTLYLFKIILLILYFPILSCKSTKFYAGKGKIAGKQIEIELDSNKAVTFLKNKEIMVSELSEYNSKILNNNTLGKIVENYSIDTANLYLLYRLYDNNSKNLRFQNKYYQKINSLRKNGTGKLDNLHALKKYKIVFVPGLAYKLDKTTGADFARQRKLFNDLGIESDLVETDELGQIDENALLIYEYLAKSKSNKKKIILVSASKGSLDLIEALKLIEKKKLTFKIHAWVNVGGIMKGTYIADENCTFPKSALAAGMLLSQGKTLKLVGDLKHENRSKVDITLKTKYKIIHLVGLPFKNQVSDEIKSRYNSLSNYGPNDGLTTITDAINPKGIIISEIGLDHYFKDKEIDLKTLALVSLVIEN